MIRRTRKTLNLFEDAVGGVPLNKLKKAHGAQFIAFLLNEDKPLGAMIENNQESYVSALLNVADGEGLIVRIRWARVSISQSGAKQWEPWIDAELKLMYCPALNSNRMYDVPGWQDVNRIDDALVLILLHAGARSGEIAQLRRGDFQVRDGVTAIRLFTGQT